MPYTKALFSVGTIGKPIKKLSSLKFLAEIFKKGKQTTTT